MRELYAKTSISLSIISIRLAQILNKIAQPLISIIFSDRRSYANDFSQKDGK